MEKEATGLTEGLISVVVPVYNVEKYLKRCVDSILKQTYKDLDIILVDDGSSDNSGKICDKYKEKYNNIQVIHQKNQGLSMARNNGIKMAKGSYITFVDSDDWLKENMVELLFNAIKEHKADIASVGLCDVYDTGQIKKNTKYKGIQILTKEEALESFLFNGYLTVCVCGKLYRTDLWNGIQCPSGKLFEDQYTTYKLLDKSEKIVFVPDSCYYYYKRYGSIGHSEFNNKTYDLYNGIQEEYNFISNKYPILERTLAVARITWEIVFINMMLRGSKQEDEKLISKTRKFARKRITDVYKCQFIGIVRKIQVSLFAFFFQYIKKCMQDIKNQKV